jgi:hypothetical protein
MTTAAAEARRGVDDLDALAVHLLDEPGGLGPVLVEQQDSHCRQLASRAFGRHCGRSHSLWSDRDHIHGVKSRIV